MLAHTTFGSINNAYLGEINVHAVGAKKTKEITIASLVKKCLEKEDYKSWELIDNGRLEQCLYNSRLFESVEVHINKPEIDVTVEEQWSLIPAPVAYSADGKRSFGVYLIDSNFLGYGKTAEVGGTMSTEGNTFTLFYLDPSVCFTDSTIQTAFNQSATERDQYQKNNIVYGYTKKEQSLLFSPGYRIIPTMELSVLLSYANRQYENIDPYTTIPGDYWSYGTGVRLSYTNADYKLYYHDGISANVQWLRQIHRSDESDALTQTTARFEWDILMFDQHALQLVLNTTNLTDNGNVGDVLMFGRTKGYRGINPNGLWTRSINAVSVDYQIPVKKIEHGIFTVAPFMDDGRYKSVNPATGNNYFAYGVGGYLFVDAINLPGVIGIIVGRNEEFVGNFISFQLGYGY